MLTEARGRNGIADPMRWQVKKLLGTIDKNKYSVLAQEFIDDEALQTFIDSNPWGEIQLIKGKDTSERGRFAGIHKTDLNDDAQASASKGWKAWNHCSGHS